MGYFDGFLVGRLVGRLLAKVIGRRVGLVVGVSEGLDDGGRVGRRDGFNEGSPYGFGVRNFLGFVVGSGPVHQRITAVVSLVMRGNFQSSSNER